MSSSDLDLSRASAAEALPRLLEEHGGRLYQLALRLCGSQPEAEDLVQETFLLAFRKWDQFEGRANPSTWLYTIASRACWRRKRRRAGEPRRLDSLSDLLPGPEDSLPDPGSLGEGPEQRSLRHEVQTTVDRAIGQLPVTYRMPLVLKEIAELSLQEVAQILGLKEATVKTRVHRGRLLLRKVLSEALPGADLAPPDHPREICLDLLAAKQESLDRGVPFPVSNHELCSRCRSLLGTLDLAHEACVAIGLGRLPPTVRRLVLARVSPGAASAPASGAAQSP